VTLHVTSTGNAARYLIREQLVGFDLPNDAVGTTGNVSGAIVLDSTGAVIAEGSRIIVRVDSLKSDQARRDNYVRGRVLGVDTFPTVELVPTRIRELHLPLPTTGTRTLTLEGNLTVKGVTKPTVWTLNATFGANLISGKAATRFTFLDFGLTKPRVRSVLSVADTIRLEYDFALRPESHRR
jgi:polyisoprenoid-binding protein YceI